MRSSLMVQPIWICAWRCSLWSCWNSRSTLTTTRRLFLHKSIASEFTSRLVAAYEKFPIGDALDSGVLVGPLIDQDAVDQFLSAVSTAKSQGGEVLVGGESLDRDGFYVKPTLIKADVSMPITKHETFAPILYIFE